MLSIGSQHAATTADGTPILVGKGSRVRYTIRPQDDSTSPTILPEETNEANERLPRSLSCNSCDGPLVDPVAGVCGHAICKACTSKGIACTKCGKPFGRLVEKRMLGWLGQAAHSCPGAGCSMTGTLHQIETHLETCELVVVQCPRQDLGCDVRLPRKDMHEHTRSCPFVRCSSFMAATLSRLEALERDNRCLRGELRVLSETAQYHDSLWHEARRCPGCSALFLPETQLSTDNSNSEAETPHTDGNVNVVDSTRASVPCHACCGCVKRPKDRHDGLPVSKLSDWRAKKRTRLLGDAMP